MQISSVSCSNEALKLSGKSRLPAIFFSRIFFQIASAFRADQFSILVEKLRKKRYSFVDMVPRALSDDSELYEI